MERGICRVSVAPLRFEANHQSEMVSQILYGETVEILEAETAFFRIRMDFDGAEGWLEKNQLSLEIDDSQKTEILSLPFVSLNTAEGKVLLSAGSELSTGSLEDTPTQDMAETAKMFLNVPYLWNGRSFFGIDSSALTQLVYKIHGHHLPRNVEKQAELGSVLDFIEEASAGDLAFFEDAEGKLSHVGLMLENQQIIHAYGKVRIDELDSSGIYNKELRQHTHKLRFVKKLID